MIVQFENFEEIDAVYVFLDVRGFTQWSRSNPGDIRRLASLIYNIADEVFESKADSKYKRRVVKNLGDGCFCVNEYRKDRLVRQSAVASFMGIFRYYQYFHAALRESNIHGKTALDLGFGTTYGASHRFYTRGQSLDYIGEKVNLASRLCGKAEKGQVVLEIEMKEHFLRAAESLGIHRPVVQTHAEEIKGYGRAEYASAQLSFSQRILSRFYGMGYDRAYISGLLHEL